jgi:hypothetical protein
MNELEVFYLQNRETMTNAEMDAHWGYDKKRFEKIGYNIRKFYLQEKGLQGYHKELVKMGVDKIDEVGVRETCRRLAEKYNVTPKTIKGDYGHMKRYGIVV